jgi:hypothetical protein
MLIENAFHYLPEILSGSNYAAQDYEAGIVNAVSLAVLQELNARNVPNPLAALSIEKLYSNAGFERPDNDPNKKRHLRADMFVDTTRTMVASEGLSRFGWRHKNYLEAKFFRPGGASSTNNAALLLGDVIRLCCLVPPIIAGSTRKKKTKSSPCDGVPAQDGKYRDICVGRYLLHVYQGSVQTLMGKKARPWAKELRSPNGSSIDVKIGDDKSATFKSALSNDLGELRVKVKFTNRVISQQESEGKTHYLCVLTRIDSFSVTFGDLSWTENDKREGQESKSGDWLRLQAAIGKHLLFTSKLKKKGEDMPPTDDELENLEDGEDEDENEPEAVDQAPAPAPVPVPVPVPNAENPAQA